MKLKVDKLFPIPTVKHVIQKSKIYISIEEQEVFDFLTNDLKISTLQQSNRSIINPFELDIVEKTLKIAIEYCGIYWHSQYGGNKHQTYHQHKLKLANKNEFKLITIFNDEWKNKNEIVKSFNKSVCKFFARKLQLKELSNKESIEFLEKTHIQGHVNANFTYALIDTDNTIKTLMSFGKQRLIMGGKAKDNNYELLRYSCELNTSVVGGASKLLSHFIKTVNPKNIISYADLRWSQCDLYKKLGFTCIKETTMPNYFYTLNYEDRLPRYKFTKKALIKEGYDPNKSEREIMKELGYDVIHDCGSMKF